jgi:hypothetical protein
MVRIISERNRTVQRKENLGSRLRHARSGKFLASLIYRDQTGIAAVAAEHNMGHAHAESKATKSKKHLRHRHFLILHSES